MRKNLLAVFSVLVLLIVVLTPAQSYADSERSLGKTEGHGTCATSGNSDSQDHGEKNSENRCYAVGDRGPGGGIVYYVSAKYFTSTGSTCDTKCRYLEVAPATWRSGGVSVVDDGGYYWSDNTSDATGQDLTTVSKEGFFGYEKFNWKIGQGFYNTSVMKVSGATSEAQAAVLAYAGTDSSSGRWFIPSMNELNELCKYARGQRTGNPKVQCNSNGNLKTGTIDYLGGFVETTYWSSTELDSTNVGLQYFRNGTLYATNKNLIYYVRPIRAF